MESYLSAEDKARVEIDRMLKVAGWAVQDARDVNLAAARGVAVREFILEPPHGRATTSSSSTAKPSE
jgi:type I restriction enzyme, R subunit